MSTVTISIRVRYAECDMQGRVFNANYLTWFDVAHTELLRLALGSYAALVKSGRRARCARGTRRLPVPGG